jgi:hypothetical protein
MAGRYVSVRTLALAGHAIYMYALRALSSCPRRPRPGYAGKLEQDPAHLVSCTSRRQLAFAESLSVEFVCISVDVALHMTARRLRTGSVARFVELARAPPPGCRSARVREDTLLLYRTRLYPAEERDSELRDAWSRVKVMLANSVAKGSPRSEADIVRPRAAICGCSARVMPHSLELSRTRGKPLDFGGDHSKNPVPLKWTPLQVLQNVDGLTLSSNTKISCQMEPHPVRVSRIHRASVLAYLALR